MKSHRANEEVPDGTTYEAMEGARAGSAVRERKCRAWINSGGAAVRIPTLTSAGKLFAASKTGANVIGNKSGDGSVRRSCSTLYWDFSAEQQPHSPQSVLEPRGDCTSVAQRRNSRPGIVSSWQCAEAGSQMKATSAKKVFLKKRTHNMDA